MPDNYKLRDILKNHLTTTPQKCPDDEIEVKIRKRSNWKRSLGGPGELVGN
jgi:hypothetical protein